MSLVIDPPTTTMNMVNTGFKKSHLPPYKVVVLSFLAGFYLTQGAQAAFVINTSMDPVSTTTKYLSGIAFSVGLMCIILAGAELFTGNCLILVSVLARRVTVPEMLFDWMLVWLGNFLGCIFGAAIMFGAGVNGGHDFTDYHLTVVEEGKLPPVGHSVCKTADYKSHLPAQEIFFRGILANLLVCLSVIMAATSKSVTGKVLVCLIGIATFVAGGYEHCIANMYTFSLATMLRCPIDNFGYYWFNLLLSTAGNISGAAILAVAYWISYLDGPETDADPNEDNKPTDGLEVVTSEPNSPDFSPSTYPK